MNKPSNHFLRVLAIGFVFCLAAMLLSSPLAAQSTFGSISGTVTDASGAAVPGRASHPDERWRPRKANRYDRSGRPLFVRQLESR